MTLTESDDPASDGAATPEAAADETVTRIDLAWRAMRACSAEAGDAAHDEAAVDAAAAAFVDAILAEFVVCPVWEEEGEPPAADRAQPKLIQIESGEALALFDAEERLASYLDAPSAFIALPGRDFFQLAAAHGLAVAFNPTVAESAMTFSPASVAAIAELIVAGEEAQNVERGAALEARPPSATPEALLAALGARLAAAADLVAEAWLFDAIFEAEPPRLVLGVVASNGATEDAVSRLASELSRLGGAILGGAVSKDGGVLNVAVLRAEDAVLPRLRAVGVGITTG